MWIYSDNAITNQHTEVAIIDNTILGDKLNSIIFDNRVRNLRVWLGWVISAAAISIFATASADDLDFDLDKLSIEVINEIQPISREITAIYKEALETMLASTESDERKSATIQDHLKKSGFCRAQRMYLGESAKSSDKKTKYYRDAYMFSHHYGAFGFALHELGYANVEIMVKELGEAQPFIMKEVRAIYDRSAKSDSDQMSDEVYNLFNTCNKLVGGVKNTNRQAKERLEQKTP